MIHSLTDPLGKISLRRRYALMVADGAFSHKIEYVKFLGQSKLLHWVKSYGDFGEGRYFTWGWSCIGKGLRLKAAQ